MAKFPKRGIVKICAVGKSPKSGKQGAAQLKFRSGAKRNEGISVAARGQATVAAFVFIHSRYVTGGMPLGLTEDILIRL